MLKQLKKKSEGFTIIEVMIVLAIAGLILLIVFLAVPALQRNQRNTQRKNDTAQIAAAVANYISNNQGNLPAFVSDDATNTNSIFVADANPYTSFEGAKLSFYTTSKIGAAKAAATNDNLIYIGNALASPAKPTLVAPGGGENLTNVSTNSIAIVLKEDCTPTANPRTAAIWYATEAGSGNGNLQCVEQ